MTSGIVLGAVVAIGLAAGLDDSEEQLTVSVDLTSPSLDAAEPSSSTVQHEPPAPPSPPLPFYASLFVAGATWTLPCTTSVGTADGVRSNVLRCRVASVEVTARETRARIACWFVDQPEVAKPDPAINTYVMTAEGLYIGDATGEPIFTPDPIPKSLPKGWGYVEPSGIEPMHADAMVRHNGAWCRSHEKQGIDVDLGTTECISRRGLVGSSDHRNFIRHRCGDVP